MSDSPAIINATFQEAGLLSGDAVGWTLLSFTAGQRIAGFGPLQHRGWEDFERWYSYHKSFQSGMLVALVTDSMESGWHNSPFIKQFACADLYSTAANEDLETGWANDAYITSWDDAAYITAHFGILPEDPTSGDKQEGFESGWRSNESYLMLWNAEYAITAQFDTQTATSENFNSWEQILTL